jgi:hypothetical protein
VLINQPKSITLKMRGHKLRSGVNWQGVKQDLGVHDEGSVCGELGFVSELNFW